MFYHLAKTTIRTSDTDCLIIAQGCYQFLGQSLKVWIRAGTSNTHRYVSVNLSDLTFCQFYVFYNVFMYYFVVTIFCLWARWGEIVPLGGGGVVGGSRVRIRPPWCKSFLHHIDDIVSVRWLIFMGLMG